jgi:hypothetical protein
VNSLPHPYLDYITSPPDYENYENLVGWLYSQDRDGKSTGKEGQLKDRKLKDNIKMRTAEEVQADRATVLSPFSRQDLFTTVN